MDPERWQRLSPLLDALFELDDDERERSLRLMREEDPQTADDLEELLKLETDREDFLSEPLVAPLPGPRPGVEVGPYRLERMLGEGGMGQVWLAARADGLYQRRVALKLLRPGLVDPNLRLRFTRERQILARLAHPHIARLLDAGMSHDHQPYLALEYIEGEPITDYCRAHRLSLESRLDLFHQVCDAVSHAHANLIVHRDLKPSNILVTPAGDVRLLDFGIAKLIDTDLAAPEQTRTGVRAFTLHYAAPEQVRGEPVSTMTDVYSLGVVLYELLADAKPYRLKRQTDAEWEEAILQGDPTKPSSALQRQADAGDGDTPMLRRRARNVTGDLDNIVLKALAKKPEQRYPSVEAMSLDLERYLAGKPVLARPQSVGYRLRKYVIRHRWALATGIVVTGVLGAALTIVAWQGQQAVQETARAQALQDFVIGLFEGAGAAPRDDAIDMRSLLDNGIVRANSELARQPLARAEVFGIIARLRLGLGDYPEAMSLLNRQAEILKSVGDDAPASLQIEAATQQGLAHRQLDDPRKCIDAMQPWMERARREQSQLPAQVAEFYSQLARCRSTVGEFNGARQLLEYSMTIRRETLDDEAGVAENLFDLANVDADAGKSDVALASLRNALAFLQQRVGERHPLAIQIHRRIAILLREKGLPGEAAKSVDAALALSAELLGERHPTTLALHRQRASVYMEQGWLDVAERDLRDTTPLLIERVGERHVDVGASFYTLGMLAWEQGRLEEAERDLGQAVAIWRTSSARTRMVRAMAEHAQVLQALGRVDEARAEVAQAAQLAVAQLGLKHPFVADVEYAHGLILATEGDHAGAKARLSRAATLSRNAEGQPAMDTQAMELSLAREQARDGDAKAIATLQRMATAAPTGGSEPRNLRWRARAYLGEAECRGADAAQARANLDALANELHASLPQGGRLPREVAAIRTACAPPSMQ
ncbi:serine/threonine-protein kinase [Noviluteimonas gilva]|uniref:Protein kinase n=1 Tax=Noviluteimonas gilva TaxID=2682097 RepID=A0A7C9HKY0_9GAMM|nr:serine/threonine-protein kinase [Lysobacter gilvus]MUV13235.1 protein kinase [Lysobacter gilvus]